MPLKAVIFDMDGVLIDSAEDHAQAWRGLANELGVSVDPALFLATFGRKNRDIVPLLFGPDLTPDRIRELGHRKEAIYRSLIPGRVREVDGAGDLVRDCRRSRLRLAVGSSAPRENIDLALNELGLAEAFPVIVHAGDVSHGKPDPQVFLIAAERLAVSPAECAVIEDAPSGLTAARAAGMTAVGVTTAHPADRLAAAHHVVNSLRRLNARAIQAIHGNVGRPRPA